MKRTRRWWEPVTADLSFDSRHRLRPRGNGGDSSPRLFIETFKCLTLFPTFFRVFDIGGVKPSECHVRAFFVKTGCQIHGVHAKITL